MCETPQNLPTKAPKSARRKIWQLDATWHCLIVGTCLSLADLRRLARKLDLSYPGGAPSDYGLHSFFVGEAGRPGLAGKSINKLLDRKHSGALRRFSKAETAEALDKLWQSSFERGDIPGPLWACATHPLLTPAVGTEIYGEVHMLSHMVGAANRADVAALKRLENHIATLERKVELERERRQRQTEKNRELVEKLNGRRQKIGSVPDHRKSDSAENESVPRRPNDAGSSLSAKERQELARLTARVQDQQRLMDSLTQDLRTAQTRETALARECAALEQLIGRHAGPEETGSAIEPGCPFDFAGQCILYVGGRTAVVCRLREFVRQGNGLLLHHDGGLEKSIDELASAVARADRIVFPTDCVSHSAVKKLKTLCRRNMKPYVPLRSAGISSFVAGLKTGPSDRSVEG